MALITVPCDVGEGGGTAILLTGGELEEDREGVAMVDDAVGDGSVRVWLQPR